VVLARVLTGSHAGQRASTEPSPEGEALVLATPEQIGTPAEGLSSWTDYQSGNVGSMSVVAAAAASTLRTYYVDAVSGSDANSGTSPTRAWKTVQRASNATFLPGDRLVFRRGQTFAGSLNISESGTSTAAIYIAGYGSGMRPVITGASSCVRVSGSYVVIHGFELRDCSWAGIEMASGARFNTIVGSRITKNIAGVHLASGSSNNRVVANRIQDNTKMSKLTTDPNDDNGAFGVLVNGDMNEIAYNTLTGHDAYSYDYGRDGAAIEIYGGQWNHVHHNLAIDNDAFAELGNSRTSTNLFGYNVVRSSLPTSSFLVTRGAEDGRGPVNGTRLYNNTAMLTGSQSQGFVCHGGCSREILQLRNNIIGAGWKAGYADGPVDEDYNLFQSGQLQFTVGAHSIVGDPAFVSGSAGNLELQPGSRAIDAGVNSPYQKDFFGRAVPQDGNGDGRAATDMGALEFSPADGSPSARPTATPLKTSTPTATPFPTPSKTGTPTPAPTKSPAPTATPTPAPTPTAPPSSPGSGSVTAVSETDSVPHSGDAADDPAIWVHPLLPGLSAVIGTDKLGGLAVYDLSGRQLHYYSGIRPNNVDVRYGFSLGGAPVDIVTASETDSDTILVYKIDPVTRALIDIRAQARDTGFGVSGLCMYKSPASGRFYVFVSDSSGNLRQFELFTSGTAVDYKLVRTLSFSSVTEGCVADDYRQTLYISQEDVALWRLSAEPNGGSVKAQVAAVDGSVLTADLEGLAIYDKGDGAGYLIASSQGSDDFAVFDRQTGAYRGRFRVAEGSIDAVTHTDGIDVTSANLGGHYSGGLFVAQDDRNNSGNQNFKLVPWNWVAQAVKLQ
jgi:myo-inositol-hexaphosphate 3-phosphohydrolase